MYEQPSNFFISEKILDCIENVLWQFPAEGDENDIVRVTIQKATKQEIEDYMNREELMMLLFEMEEKKKEGDVEGFLAMAELLLLRLDELDLFFK